MRVEIRSLQRIDGTTALYVTHDQEEAFSISDRVAIMDAGRIVQFDAPEVLYRRRPTAPSSPASSASRTSSRCAPSQRIGDTVIAELAGGDRLSLSQEDFGAIPDRFTLAARPDGLLVQPDRRDRHTRATRPAHLSRPRLSVPMRDGAGHACRQWSARTPFEPGVNAVLVPVPRAMLHPRRRPDDGDCDHQRRRPARSTTP